MNLKRQIIAVLLPLAASAQPIDWTVHVDHAGPIRIGMTLTQVRRAIADPKAYLWGSDPNLPMKVCAYLESDRIEGSGLGFMFSRGRVVRIDVSKPGIKTAQGAGIGDSEDQIKKLYPNRITTEPGHYYGRYLNYKDPAKGRLGIVFETDGSLVDSYRVGILAAIALVEGCS